MTYVFTKNNKLNITIKLVIISRLYIIKKVLDKFINLTINKNLLATV